MSLTIAIQFLTNYCVAARSKTDPQPEWPRIRRALYGAAAAHFECFDGSEETAAALVWLQSLNPPEIHCSPHATSNVATPTFVPTNARESVAKGGMIQTIPSLKRSRAERLFPRTHLPEAEETIYFVWSDTSSGGYLAALERLCSAVSRLGHSSSLVNVRVVDEPAVESAATTWIPAAARPQMQLRVSRPGTLKMLETSFATPPHRPVISTSHGYSERLPAASEFGRTQLDPQLDLFKLVPEGAGLRWMQLETTLALTWTLRRAILEHCPRSSPALSGHEADGSPSSQPHMALFPLAFVGSPYADGHLLGVALAVPRGIGDEDERMLASALDMIADEAEMRVGGWDSTTSVIPASVDGGSYVNRSLMIIAFRFGRIPGPRSPPGLRHGLR